MNPHLKRKEEINTRNAHPSRWSLKWTIMTMLIMNIMEIMIRILMTIHNSTSPLPKWKIRIITLCRPSLKMSDVGDDDDDDDEHDDIGNNVNNVNGDVWLWWIPTPSKEWLKTTFWSIQLPSEWTMKTMVMTTTTNTVTNNLHECNRKKHQLINPITHTNALW